MSVTSMLAGVGAVVLAAVVGATAGWNHREPTCERPADSIPVVVADGRADIAHLHDDALRARAAARAFAEAVARRPRISDSVDAQEGARTAPARALAWCESLLSAQIAVDHQVPLDLVRAQLSESIDSGGTTEGAAQAVTDRASGSTSVSAVVSRPAR